MDVILSASWYKHRVSDVGECSNEAHRKKLDLMLRWVYAATRNRQRSKTHPRSECDMKMIRWLMVVGDEWVGA